MDPAVLSLVVGLLGHVPDILHLFGASKSADVASRVIGIAQQVTGAATGDAALAAINADPNVALQFRKAVLDQQVQLETIAAQREKDDAAADSQADQDLTSRMAMYEGTAKDLMGIPYLGAFMLFLRGSQRILIGYGTAWIDYLWLVGNLGTVTQVQQNLIFTASILVFVVLFGERAVKNVAPLIVDLLNARGGTGK